jgi:hypothetical protein
MQISSAAFFACVIIVVALLVLRALLRARASRLRPVVEEPRPPQIIAAIQAAPLLEQTRAAKAYVGMKVRWQVTFEEVIVSGLMLDLMLQDPASLRPGTPFAWVLCSVRRGKYPQLNGMVQHTPLWVSGQIQSVKSEMITLKNPQIEFEN